MSELPTIINSGWKGLKIWQKIAAFLAVLAILALGSSSIIGQVEKARYKRDIEALQKEQDERFEKTKKTFQNIIEAYQDSVIAAKEERKASIDRFNTLVSDYNQLKALHDEQKYLVLDSTDRLNELQRISAAEGIK